MDFETGYRDNVCNFSVVMVKDGQIVASKNSLVCWFKYGSVGMGFKMPKGAGHFVYEWMEIRKRAKIIFGKSINDIPFVMHNLEQNFKCFKPTCDVYEIEYANINFIDTLTKSRQFMPGWSDYQLKRVASACCYDTLQYKQAHSNAELCAMIALKLF